MLSSGIGVMDTQYDGRRAPLYDEVCDRIKGYYRERYGEESPQYRTCLPGDRTSSGNRLTFEPHVAEAVLEQLLAEQPALAVLRGWVVDGVERDVDRIIAVHLRQEDGTQRQRLAAALFVDATYTADLAARTGVPYRVGREDRYEFGEPHAGRVFSRRVNQDGVATYPRVAVEGALNLRPFQSISTQVFAGSTGEGDHKVQSYHLRLCMSRDPANQHHPPRPARYDRDYFLRRFRGRWPRIGGNPIPNHKANWWTNYIGEGWGLRRCRRAATPCHRRPLPRLPSRADLVPAARPGGAGRGACRRAQVGAGGRRVRRQRSRSLRTVRARGPPYPGPCRVHRA